MKYMTLGVAVALTLLAAEAAFARGHRGCPGGSCSVGKVTAVQAPVQKELAKGEPSPSDRRKQAAEAAPAAPEVAAAQPQAAPTTTTQRTRRFAAFSRLSRRGQ